MSSGMLAAPFPSFQRRGGRAAAGVVSKRSRSHLILFEFTNHPVCAAEERDLFINGAAYPSLETRGMELAATAGLFNLPSQAMHLSHALLAPALPPPGRTACLPASPGPERAGLVRLLH